MKNLPALFILNTVATITKADPTPALPLNQTSKQTDIEEIPYLNQTKETAYDDSYDYNFGPDSWEHTYWLNPVTNCAAKTSIWFDYYDYTDPEHTVTIDMLDTCNFTILSKPPFTTPATETYCTCFYGKKETCSDASFLLYSYNASDPACEPDNTCAKTAVSKACDDFIEEEDEIILETWHIFGIIMLSAAALTVLAYTYRKTVNSCNRAGGCKEWFRLNGSSMRNNHNNPRNALLSENGPIQSDSKNSQQPMYSSLEIESGPGPT